MFIRQFTFQFLAAFCAFAPVKAGLITRWSFNNPSAPAPSGTTFADPISGVVATVRGNGANLNGTALVLPGTTNGRFSDANISAYVNLPNGLISTKTNLTVEIWATPVTAKTQQRLFDFGNATTGDGLGAAGEWTGATAPGATSSSDDLMLGMQNGAALTNPTFSESRLNGGTKYQVISSFTSTAGTSYHYVLTFSDGIGTHGSGGGQIAWYRNGVLAGKVDVPYHLSSIEDVNNWLGRSQFSGDSNANIAFDEVRLYDHALTPAEVNSSFAAGPDATFPAPVANPDSATLHLGQKVRIPVLANDTGSPSANTVTVVTPPTSGTATVQSDGTILYAQTTGAPTTDSFTYRANNSGGPSNVAAVTVNFTNALRIPNGTLNVPSTPPPLAIQVSAAFPGLATFNLPLCIRSAPGDAKRLWICEKTGVLKLIPDVTASSPAQAPFLDLPAWVSSASNPRGAETVSSGGEQGLLGVAFHPNYANNRFFYVFYSARVTSTGSIYERVSRFTTQAANPNLADPASELVLINQVDPAGNHNGGDLHFGPDGYLYVSLGDGGNQNDSLGHSQKIDKDFFAGILRIDVDKKPGNLEPNPQPSAPTAIPRDANGNAYYSVPADNPFVGATTFNGSPINAANVRSEFWSVGLRNPWRMSFDAQTGELWCGNVGQDKYEGIMLITKGSNSGWAYYEQNHNGPRIGSLPNGFSYSPPIYEYPHAGVTTSNPNYEGSSVTGGIVYRGSRFPSLFGTYLFADYSSGNIWSLVRNGGAPTVTRIAGQTGLVAFGTDPSNGDVLMANINTGTIQRLTVVAPSGSFPQTLSATGLFADLTDLSPSPGVLPYEPNLTFWSDFAAKRRWFVIPDANNQMSWNAEGPWSYPNGMIWVKHFDMELTRTNPPTSGGAGPRKRIETRLLVKNSTGVYGVSYRWNDAGTDATLVDDGGADLPIAVTQNGTAYTQQWHIPSRSDCLACHNSQAGGALSFNTRQLNRTHTINGFAGNQIDLLRNAGYFSNTPASTNLLPRHLRPDEINYPLEARVRSYLSVNCAYCHQAGGSGPSWDARPELTLKQTGLIHGPATSALNPGDKLVVPDDPNHSVTYNRIALTNGYTRMPPLGSNELDQTNIDLVQQWISTLNASHPAYDQWRQAHFGDLVSPQGDPNADPDGDGQNNHFEYLANTGPLNASSNFRPVFDLSGSQASLHFDLPQNRSAFVETSTDLLSWSLWDVPDNNGLLQSAGPFTIGGPVTGSKRFFRLRIEEN